jgi:hypothetical protein
VSSASPSKDASSNRKESDCEEYRFPSFFEPLLIFRPLSLISSRDTRPLSSRALLQKMCVRSISKEIQAAGRKKK